MRKKVWIPIIVGIVLAVVGGSLGGIWVVKHGKDKSVESVEIVSILPLTGTLSSFGEEMKKGQELAVKLINEDFFWNQEKKFTVIFEDSKVDPKEALATFNRQRFAGRKFFITTLSPITLTLIPVAKKEEVLLFADAAHPKISNSGKYIFRHSSTAPQEAQSIVDFINLNFPDSERVAVVAINNDYGVSLHTQAEKEIKDSGRKVVQSMLYPPKDADFRSIALQILSNDPEIVIVGGLASDLGSIIRRLKEYNYQGVIIANNAFGYPDAQSIAGEAGEGVYYVAFDFERTSPVFLQVNEEYKKKYGTDMSDLSILEFNTVFLLARALHASESSDIETIASYFHKIGQFKGIGEQMTILQNGDILPKIKIVKKEGKSKPEK